MAKQTRLYVIRCARVHQGVRKVRDFVVNQPVIPPAAYKDLWRFVDVQFQVEPKIGRPS